MSKVFRGVFTGIFTSAIKVESELFTNEFEAILGNPKQDLRQQFQAGGLSIDGPPSPPPPPANDPPAEPSSTESTNSTSETSSASNDSSSESTR